MDDYLAEIFGEDVTQEEPEKTLDDYIDEVYEEMQAEQDRKELERAEMDEYINEIYREMAREDFLKQWRPEGAIAWVTDGGQPFGIREATKIAEQMEDGKLYVLDFLLLNREGDFMENYGKMRTDGLRGGDFANIGKLMGIDLYLWSQSDASYKGLVQIFYTLEAANDANAPPGPYRDGVMNCVLTLLRGHVASSSRKAQDTIDAKLKVIDRAALRIGQGGCSLEDIGKLETALRIKIVVKDIRGGVLWDSGKYEKRYERFEFVGHNNHAWAEFPEFPRQVTEVAYYEKPPCKEKHLHKPNEAIAALALQEETTAVFFLGPHTYVTSRGRLVKPRQEHDEIEFAVSQVHHLDYCDGSGARAKTDEQRKALEESEKATSANQYLFKEFVTMNGITAVRTATADVWTASAVEYRTWCAGEAIPGYDQIDMKSCFPSFAMASNAAHDYFKRFGFAAKDHTARFSVNGRVTKDSPEMQVNGVAEVVGWRFRQGLHPYFGLYGSHFEQKRWTPIPLLAYFLDEGILSELEVRDIYVALEVSDRVDFPVDPREHNGWCRKMLGSLTKDCDTESVGIKDAGEAGYLVERLAGEEGRFRGRAKVGDLTVVSFRSDVKRKQHPHCRASFMAYTHIALCRKLVTLNGVRRVNCDALLAPHRELASEPDDGPLIKPGQWRKKGGGAYKHEPSQNWTGPMEGKAVWEKGDSPKLGVDPIQRRLVSYLWGQGGCGKTTRAIKAFPGRSMVVLAPSNDLADAHRTKCGVEAATYHKFFRYSGRIGEWTPERMEGVRLPDVIVWDEINYVPLAEVKPFLAFLQQRNVQVVLCGDPGQIPSVGMLNDREVFTYLLQQPVYVEKVTKDYRAEGDKALQDLKLAMWMKGDPEQLAAWRAAVPGTDYEEFLQQWTPGDTVIASTNARGTQLEATLLEEHRQRFPKQAYPIAYNPVNGRAQNVEVQVPGTRRKVHACRGTIVGVPLSAAKKLDENWRSAAWTTVHRVQGRTITNPAVVWVFDEQMTGGFFRNLAYTAVSRVQRLSQLRRVVLPDTRPELPKTDPQEQRASIEAKLWSYRTNDERKGFAGGEPLTADHVIAMGCNCSVCGQVVAWHGWKERDPRQFSLDRLDNEKPHVVGNVRLTCLGCNINRCQPTEFDLADVYG